MVRNRPGPVGGAIFQDQELGLSFQCNGKPLEDFKCECDIV